MTTVEPIKNLTDVRKVTNKYWKRIKMKIEFIQNIIDKLRGKGRVYNIPANVGVNKLRKALWNLEHIHMPAQKTHADKYFNLFSGNCYRNLGLQPEQFHTVIYPLWQKKLALRQVMNIKHRV